MQSCLPIPLTLPSCSIEVALAAIPRPRPVRRNVEVLSTQRMTIFAMSFERILITNWMLRLVRFVRDQFKMRRIHTATSFATMMQNQLFGQWSDQQLVDYSVNTNRTTSSTHRSIAIGADVAQPEPAAGIRLRVNLLLQALRQRRQFKRYHATPVWPKGCAGVNLLAAT
jgi:hypothetical protein